MRFAPRLFRRPPVCLAPATPSELIERGLEAARDVVEAAAAVIEAAPGPHRGRSTAVTVAAVTATALVATAAYVWWKRRDRVTSIGPASTAASPAGVPMAAAPAGAPAAPATVSAEDRPAATADPGPVAIAPAQAAISAEDCARARPGTPQPSVVASTSHSTRPPVLSGRFAMPGVRGIVLPGSGGSLP